MASFGVQPRTIVEALPNRATILRVPGRELTLQFSTHLVVGVVADVGPGPAYAHGEVDGEVFPVGYDDPAAKERSVIVRIAVDELFDGEGHAVRRGVADFQWGGLGYLDTETRQNQASYWREAGRAVIFLKTLETREPPVTMVAMQGRLWGWVTPGDELRFPRFQDDEAQPFLGEIRTLTQLRRIAAEPKIVVDRFLAG